MKLTRIQRRAVETFGPAETFPHLPPLTRGSTIHALVRHGLLRWGLASLGEWRNDLYITQAGAALALRLRGEHGDDETETEEP